MAVGVFEDPLLGGLFGDDEVAGAFAAEATLERYRAFEAALTRALAAEGLIDDAAAEAILAGCASFRPDVAAIDTLTERFGAAPLMGRTRMQAAVSITVGDRIAAWRAPLPRHLDRLAGLSPRLHALQFGGAVGTRHALGDRGEAVAARLAEALGFAHAPRAGSH